MKGKERLLYRRTLAPRFLALAFAAALAMLAVLLAPPAYPQVQGYEFTRVADSARDGFDPFSFGCAAINNPGDIAFQAGRIAPDGFNTIPGIYRANANGSLTTIAEDRKRFQTIGFNPSINNLGQVSFAARLDARDRQTGDNIEAILRGDGKKLTTIASTGTSSTSSASTPPSTTTARSPSRRSSTTSMRGSSRDRVTRSSALRRTTSTRPPSRSTGSRRSSTATTPGPRATTAVT